jgi:uncharacterized Zn-finger protein
MSQAAVINYSNKVSCNGDDLSSKHPLIYLNIKNKNQVKCPYCGKIFVNKKVK